MISSTKNAQVKRITELRKKAKVRKETGLFVVEGMRMCLELRPEETQAVFVSESFCSQKENGKLLQQFSSYEVVTDQVLEVMADTKTPQGILAVARQRHYTLEDMFPAEKPALLMILDTLQDPGNLGTIIRAGEGAGVTGVIMSQDTADIYNPKVIRSTMGSVFRMPFLYADSLEEMIPLLKKKGVKLFAAHLKGKHSYDMEDYTESTGFLVGNEANGLSEAVAELADTYIKIPMEGQVESLNAAVAASILMFETARQRRNH